jgi:hypothetical protein
MSDRTFRRDTRAIEGLPIRLVIALVVGIASLSVMMSMIDGMGSLGVSEVDVRPTPDVTTPGAQDLEVAVVGPQGEPVADATVIATGGSARLDGTSTATTDANGTATLSVAPRLGPNQDRGTVTLDVKPPAGQYADERENTGVLVVRE